MNFEKDIFELSRQRALLTWALSQGECFVLSETDLPRVSIPNSFDIKTMVPKRSSSPIEKKLAQILEPLARKYALISGEYLGFQAATYEALLNAYQHGNNGDDSKKIILASQITSKRIEVLVQDLGGKLDPVFGIFVIQKRIRRGMLAKSFYEFAREFTNRQPHKENEGRGIQIIHRYFDEVRYYRSQEDGLITHMRKKIK